MNKISSLVLLIAVTSSLLVTTPAEAIIRRHDLDDQAYIVEATDYPAMVDLLELGDCIATLIAPQWLITAAHCAEHFRLPGSLTIAGESFEVTSIKIPQNWEDDLDDIALVELKNPVSSVEPLGLYRESNEVGQMVWFVGRGDTNTGLNGQSGARVDGNTRRASNTIVAADSWWIEFVFNSPDDSEVSELEGISGDGDSGGPALIETPEGLKVAGLSSYQDEGNNSLGTYGVREYYTRVSRYRSWIAEHMGTGSETDSGTDGVTEPVDSSEPGSQDGISNTTNSESGGCSGLPAKNSPLFLALLLGLFCRRFIGREKMCA